MWYSGVEHVRGGMCVWQWSSRQRVELFPYHLWPLLLFTVLMLRLTYEVPLNVIFEGDIVICNDSREQVKGQSRDVEVCLRGEGMNVSHSGSMCLMRGSKFNCESTRSNEKDGGWFPVPSNAICGKECEDMKHAHTGWYGWRKVTGVMCVNKLSAGMKEKVCRAVATWLGFRWCLWKNDNRRS